MSQPGDPISDTEKLDLAKKATLHALEAICDDPRKYWLLGEGTETYASLTRAYAALFGVEIDKVRKAFRPRKLEYDRYCEQREANEALLLYCAQEGITAPGE